MSRTLRHLSLGVALGFLPLGAVLAGKLWDWQGLLVGLVGAVALTLWATAALLPEPPPEPEPTGKKRGKRKGASEPAAAPQPTPARGPDLVDWALVAFLIWQALSWGVSVYRFATGVYLAKLLACAAVFWILRYGLWRRASTEAEGDSPRGWRVALWAVALGGVVLSVIGLREYVRTVFFLGDVGWRVFGTMANPNAAAGYLLVAIFPAAALLLGSQSRGRSGGTDLSPARPRYPEIAALFSLLLMLATLLLTGSKAALAALLVGIVLFGLVGLRGNRRGQAAVIGLALLMVVAAFLVPPLRQRILSAFGWQSHSTVFRLYTWQATLDMIQARPWLGFGGGTFANIFPRFAIAGFTRAAHQSFLQIAAETGLPGLLLALAWGGLVLHSLLATARAQQPLVKFAAAAALAGLVASALQELFDYPWYVPAVSYSFFALAGVALAGETRRCVGPRRTVCPHVGDRRARAAIMTAALVGLLLTIWCGKSLVAEAVAARGDAEMAVGAYAAASATYERAAAWNPGQASFATQMARCEEALAAGGDSNALARALQARLRAVALQPTEPQNYLALARLYDMAGRQDEALAAARAALQNYPNYPRGLADLGQLQKRAGQHAAALQTYRQLLALRDSPVGRYPPVDSVTETAYARGWIALGDEAVRNGQVAEALTDYGQATLLLAEAINQAQATREATGGEIRGFGRVAEDAAMAEEVLTRLRRINTALSVMRQAQLTLALRRQDEGRTLLERLAEQRAPGAGEADWLAVNWGRLRLAQELRKDEPKRAVQLARKVDMILAPSSPETVAKRGWLPEDTASLKSLQQWAQTQTDAPLYRRAPLLGAEEGKNG